MLEKVHELCDSMTISQASELREALGETLYSLLDSAFESETEAEAADRVAAFVSEAKKSPRKLIKARKVLDEDQKNIIIEFVNSWSS